MSGKLRGAIDTLKAVSDLGPTLERIASALESLVQIGALELQHHGIGHFTIGKVAKGEDEGAIYFVDDERVLDEEQRKEAFFELHGRAPREDEKF